MTTVGDKDGKLISDLKLSQTAPDPIKFLEIDGEEEKVPSFENFSDDDDPPSMLSIEEADKKLKKLQKSRNWGNFLSSDEQFKYGAHGLQPWLRNLFELVRKEENIPGDWRKWIIEPLFQMEHPMQQ